MTKPEKTEKEKKALKELTTKYGEIYQKIILDKPSNEMIGLLLTELSSYAFEKGLYIGGDTALKLMEKHRAKKEEEKCDHECTSGCNKDFDCGHADDYHEECTTN